MVGLHKCVSHLDTIRKLLWCLPGEGGYTDGAELAHARVRPNVGEVAMGGGTSATASSISTWHIFVLANGFHFTAIPSMCTVNSNDGGPMHILGWSIVHVRLLGRGERRLIGLCTNTNVCSTAKNHVSIVFRLTTTLVIVAISLSTPAKSSKCVLVVFVPLCV